MVEKIITVLGTLIAIMVMVPQGNRGQVATSSQLIINDQKNHRLLVISGPF